MEVEFTTEFSEKNQTGKKVWFIVPKDLFSGLQMDSTYNMIQHPPQSSLVYGLWPTAWATTHNSQRLF